MKLDLRILMMGLVAVIGYPVRQNIAVGQPADSTQSKPEPLYEHKADHHPDGIGKFYMGREISHVMGHRGADWLERPERIEEERPDLLIEELELQPGQKVADIGAGTGYITRRLAKAVGSSGRVYGVDIQPEMLARLKKEMKRRGLDQVQAVRGTVTDPNLPEGELDLVVMVDVYHEFSHPYEMMQGICRSLSPEGRVAFVEYRGEDPSIPIKELHKMTEAQVRKEAALHPLEWVETIESLPRQHVIVFKKKAAADEEKEK